MRLKFTAIIFALSAVICGVMFAEYGKIAWLYALACAIIVLFVFLAEVMRND